MAANQHSNMYTTEVIGPLNNVTDTSLTSEQSQRFKNGLELTLTVAYYSGCPTATANHLHIEN